MKRPQARSRPRVAARPPASSKASRLGVDEAFIALFIGAMEANHHVSPEEAARAHHIIWSMKRFRRKSGEAVGRLIDRMRASVETQGAVAMVTIAARALPRRFRPSAFALCADLVLADGQIEPAERRFLEQLADDLGLDSQPRERLLEAILIKNSA